MIQDTKLIVLCTVPAGEGENGIHHIAISTVSKHLKIQLELDSTDIGLIDWLCIPEQNYWSLLEVRYFMTMWEKYLVFAKNYHISLMLFGFINWYMPGKTSIRLML